MTNTAHGKIFVSFTHVDWALAAALQGLVKELFGNAVVVSFSDKESEGRIDPGEDWYRWIIDQVRECDVALILLTPASVQKPWILWESGAVYGAAEATRTPEKKVNKVRPLVFQLSDNQIPSPLQRLQTVAGDDHKGMKVLMKQLLTKDFDHLLSSTQKVEASERLADEIDEYCKKVRTALLEAPLTVTEAAVQEWAARIDKLAQENRYSEIDHLHGWLRVAFGWESGKSEWPIDLRVHRRLGEAYQAAKKTKRAITEFELARRLAPRDLYLLRTLGKLYLDDKDSALAGGIIDRIGQLDPRAFEHNQECAALKGRWLEDAGRLSEAAKVYEAALPANPHSYYLYDKLGQVQLQAGMRKEAEETYRRLLPILRGLGDRNEWKSATAATASIVMGDEKAAIEYLRAIRGFNPKPNVIETIEGGLRRVQQQLGLGADAFERWSGALRT